MYTELILGSAVGITLGLTGSGGVVAVPALMLGLGLSLQQAMPVSLIAIAIASLVATLDGLRQGLVRCRAALLMAVVGSAFAPLGIWLSHRLPMHWLMLLFIALLLFISWKMVRQALQTADDHLAPSQSFGTNNSRQNCVLDADSGRFQWSVRCFATISAIGGSAGLCSGLLGVGGGFLIVPGIRQFSNLPMHSIVATSLAVITLVASSTVVHALFVSGISLPTGAWWFVGATLGGLIGGRVIAPHLPAKILQMGFAALILVVAGLMAQRFLF